MVRGDRAGADRARGPAPRRHRKPGAACPRRQTPGERPRAHRRHRPTGHARRAGRGTPRAGTRRSTSHQAASPTAREAGDRGHHGGSSTAVDARCARASDRGSRRQPPARAGGCASRRGGSRSGRRTAHVGQSLAGGAGSAGAGAGRPGRRSRSVACRLRRPWSCSAGTVCPMRSPQPQRPDSSRRRAPRCASATSSCARPATRRSSPPGGRGCTRGSPTCSAGDLAIKRPRWRATCCSPIRRSARAATSLPPPRKLADAALVLAEQRRGGEARAAADKAARIAAELRFDGYRPVLERVETTSAAYARL